MKKHNNYTVNFTDGTSLTAHGDNAAAVFDLWKSQEERIGKKVKNAFLQPDADEQEGKLMSVRKFTSRRQSQKPYRRTSSRPALKADNSLSVTNTLGTRQCRVERRIAKHLGTLSRRVAV
jgi:hypothetical protein